MEYFWDTPSDIAMRLSGNMKRIRKRKKITQKQLAARSNVSYATLRKFEQMNNPGFMTPPVRHLETAIPG